MKDIDVPVIVLAGDEVEAVSIVADDIPQELVLDPREHILLFVGQHVVLSSIREYHSLEIVRDLHCNLAVLEKSDGPKTELIIVDVEDVNVGGASETASYLAIIAFVFGIF